MKKLMTLFSFLVASLLMSVVAFPGSGPYGAFGSDPGSNMTTATEIKRDVVFRGTGPYGSVGPVIAYEGVVKSQHVAITRGSGPFGAFGPLATSGTVANKEECVIVAANCATER